MKKYLLMLLLSAAPLLACAETMTVMTVQDLKTLAMRGKPGQVAAMAYVQGAVEAYLDMDLALSNDLKQPPIFCGFFQAYKSKEGTEHPAAPALQLIGRWEMENMGMEKPAMELVRSYLMARYGQNCAAQAK